MICPYCKRELHPWPLDRTNGCAPKDWANCIRNRFPDPRKPHPAAAQLVDLVGR